MVFIHNEQFPIFDTKDFEQKLLRSSQFPRIFGVEEVPPRIKRLKDDSIYLPFP
jgi:hypothetical protein